MKNFVFHQVRGARLEVKAASRELEPRTSSLSPVLTEGRNA